MSWCGKHREADSDRQKNSENIFPNLTPRKFQIETKESVSLAAE